jgi:2-dehydro-3-deoxygluconokinase
MKPIVTFGEIMMRLSPPGFLRFGQARSFDVIYGGGEANVAVSLANYDLPVEYITRLPNNDLGVACLAYLRQYGVGTRFVARGGERLGIYFMEFGAAQRGSKVVYDRAHSSISTIAKGMVDWKAVFAEAGWFHWTGITPAISAGAAEALMEALEAARGAGVTISCDLNYRKNLWKWGKKAGEVMPDLVRLSDIAIGNEEDAEKVFNIKAEHSDVIAGKVDAGDYQQVAQALREKFTNLKAVAITLRGSLSASHNTWSGVFLSGNQFYTAPTYDIAHIVDRVGGGDSFCGGLIYGLVTKPDDPQYALNFAVAASCLKHSIIGDFNLVTKGEVETLMGGDASGRVSR